MKELTDSRLNHQISVFKDRYTKELLDLISYKDLKKYFIEDCNKDDRKCFNFSTIIGENISDNILNGSNYSTSPWCIVDIDIKDTNKKFFEQDFHNLQELYDVFDKDEHCFLIGHSSSGKGLRAIYCFDSKVGKDYIFNIFVDDEYFHEDIEKSINKWKYDIFIKYLKSIGLNLCDRTSTTGSKDSYLDLSFQRNHVQRTYSINAKLPFKFNDKFVVLNLPPIEEIRKALKGYNTKIKYNPTDVNFKEWDWNQTRINMLKTPLISFGYQEILPWISALQQIKDDDIRHDCFVWFSNNFVGKSRYKMVGSKDIFIKNIETAKFRYNTNFEHLLRRQGVKIVKAIKIIPTDVDMCHRLYDIVYEYNQYISECNIDMNKDQIVIRADAGAGKTSFSLNYCSKVNGIRIFATPTNILSNQVYKICLKKYKSLNVKKFFEEILEEVEEDCVVITNYANLSKLEKHMALKGLNASVLFLDECHRIVDYSVFDDEQPIFPVSDKVVYLSATPEPFLMGEKDYLYIDCKKRNKIIRKLKMCRCANYNQVRSLIGASVLQTSGMTNIIFYNNKDGNQKFVDAFKKLNITFDRIDQSNKGPAYDYLINNQKIKNNIVATSLINDGINILNDNISNVFIIDNHTQSVFDIYQFLQRFRNSQPNIFYFYVGGKYEQTDTMLDHTIFDSQYKSMKDKCMKDINKLKKIKNLCDEDKLKLSFVYKSRSGNMLINKNQIKQYIYNEWKNDVRLNTYLFESFLSNYFDLSHHSFIKHNKHKGKSQSKDKDFILNNLNSIVNDKINKINPNFNIIESKIYEDNQNVINKIIKRIRKIKQFGGNYNDFNLFANNVEFLYAVRKLEMEWNRNNRNRGIVEHTLNENSNYIENILIDGMSIDDLKAVYDEKELLSDMKLNLDNMRLLNKELKIYGKKFVRKGKQRKYILGNVL